MKPHVDWEMHNTFARPEPKTVGEMVVGAVHGMEQVMHAGFDRGTIAVKNVVELARIVPGLIIHKS